MKPPKCKTCGEEAWRHVCGGLPDIKSVEIADKPKLKADAPVITAAKFDRAAYMRERHAKRKAEASKI
jgi:hypothetical protein